MPRINPTHWLYPPRTSNCMPKEEAEAFCTDLGWIGQYKVNDSRAVIYLEPNGDIQIWNRHRELMDYNIPESLLEEFKELRKLLHLNGHCRLDGGLLHKKHAAIKNTVIIWDILVRDGEHLLGTTYRERYGSIMEPVAQATPGFYYIGDAHVGLSATPNIHIAVSHHPANSQKMWENIDKANTPYWTGGNLTSPIVEGIVYKDIDSPLEPGFKEKNNEGWSLKSRVQTKRHQF